jgi:hypothetical protein
MGNERRMTSEMEQKRRGEMVEGDGAVVRLRWSPGELSRDGAARPMAAEVSLSRHPLFCLTSAAPGAGGSYHAVETGLTLACTKRAMGARL